MANINIGFIGAGGIAKAHAFALTALKFYYPDMPEITFTAITSGREESRSKFAKDFGFNKAVDFETFVNDTEINTVLILSPNNLHYSHLEAALKMKNVKRIYLEKPICASKEEESKIEQLLRSTSNAEKVQIGFQFLFSSAIREAMKFWQEKDFGTPVHFSFTLKHRDYLRDDYREKRKSRLSPAPDGGAMADLGSHAISLLMAFLGEKIHIKNALQAGYFPDVPTDSDLYSEISVFEEDTKAVGNLSASRISAGMGDVMAFDIFTKNGALRYNSYYPDRFEYFMEKDEQWATVFTGSDYLPASKFPSVHVPGGWLRPLIHAHYVFITGKDREAFIPGLGHGLAVQRLVRETAEYLKTFRNTIF